MSWQIQFVKIPIVSIPFRKINISTIFRKNKQPIRKKFLHHIFRHLSSPSTTCSWGRGGAQPLAAAGWRWRSEHGKETLNINFFLIFRPQILKLIHLPSLSLFPNPSLEIGTQKGDPENFLKNSISYHLPSLNLSLDLKKEFKTV